LSLYKISDVSRKVNLSQKRIREYEKEGFIKPERSAGSNNRLYGDFEVDQIKRVTYLIHAKGFTLACLKQLLVMAPCWHVFDCQEREGCPAHQRPHEPCWKVRAQAGTNCGGPCSRCAIYLLGSRKRPRRERLLVNAAASAPKAVEPAGEPEAASTAAAPNPPLR
jgi:DNA-binding transcriptional MerR regulator